MTVPGGIVGSWRDAMLGMAPWDLFALLGGLLEAGGMATWGVACGCDVGPTVL